MKIILQPHLKIRLKERKIPQSYPNKILSKPDSSCFDNLTGHFIAIRKLKYNEKLRPMAVAYDIIGNIVQVITVHPVSIQEINNRLLRKRWVKNEES